MKITFLTTVKDEINEIKKLVPLIKKYMEPTDEIVFLMDIPHSSDVEKYLMDEDNINLYEYPLNHDFASFKNEAIKNCKGEYIFNLDSDETASEYIFQNIRLITETNSYPECIWFPRINIITGANTNSNYFNEKGWLNYPDYQQRFYKNDYPRIHWIKPVHERLTGYSTELFLPANIELAEYLAIQHIKTMERQMKQNNFYKGINENTTI